MYVIYIDVLFLLNWIMNTMIFYCVSLVLNKPVRHKQMIFCSALATSIYCMLLIVPVLQEIPYGIYALIIPVPSILILYQPSTYKDFLKKYLLSMMVAAVFGGITFNIWYLINGIQSEVQSISILLLIGIGMGTTLSFYLGFYFIRRQFIFPSFQYEITINYGEKDIQLQSLLDTGNLLYTPRKHEPVLVAEYEVVKSLLNNQQQEVYEQFRKASIEEIEQRVISGKYAIEQIIPFNSVGCKSGFLWGVRVDAVVIQKCSKKIKIAPCIVGLSSEKLFSDGQFQALLHPELILKEERVS